ncbi:DNA polymerase III subunit delta [Fructobacillus sp. M1-13]|uniref:DNA polymerase III subunit delta n=1 Tax=Fructobacillus papyriferae TaxID=2713171 RepID=A0ABS5QPB5_9LACO|nr:DNA polymerase III subunit delta [Fructobacillus papyriferae]MBS9334916.1 DNA polymerase III subunit delta [Fructobacillus papyriferae]MCD2159600.1 DNA polymerase III subunit delta [Fructobacillus papyriferae]
MTLQDLKGQIENQALPDLYIVTGEEPALLQKAKRLFTSIIPEEDQEMNFASYDFSTVGLDDAMADITAPPFFGDHRVVLLTNPTFLTANGKLTDSQEKALTSVIEQPVPGNLLVLFAGDLKLDKRKKITKRVLAEAENLDLPRLNERQVGQALHQLLEQRGFTIEPAAERELLLRTQASYSMMLQELPKLLAYASEGKKITSQAVDDLVIKESTAQAFDLADLVLKRKQEEAIRTYHDLVKNGEVPLRLNALLLGQFRLLLQVASLQGSDAEAGKALGIHPFRVKLARQSLRTYPLGKIREGFLKILDMEIQMKSKRVDPLFLFETFMVNF